MAVEMSAAYAPQERLSFGTFELDPHSGELRKAGLLIHLPPQPLKILALLASRPGELVTRGEIQKEVWGGDTFVDFEHGLNFAIKRIREALCDDAEHPRYIETLPRRGYRFIAQLDTNHQGTNVTPAVRYVPNLGESKSAPAQGHRASEQPRLTTASGITRRAVTVLVESVLEYKRQRSRWRRITGGLVALGGFACILVAFNVGGVRDRLMMAFGMHPSFPKITSIAVLPLDNLSHDPDQEFFAEGMTEELISSLAKIKSLRVISRTTVMRYKGSSKSLPEIARELNVDALVEGSVIRFGNRVRITANLLYGPTDRHLWSDTYESDVGDVLIIQGEVARTITDQIRIQVTPQEQTLLSTARTVNPEAHQAYLKGYFFLSQHAFYSTGDVQLRETLDNALEYFHLALEKDPNYAPGYVGTSLVWSERGAHYLVPPLEALPHAKAAALRALELDNSNSGGHWAIANVNFYYEWNWRAAEEEYKRALEITPNSGELHAYYSDLLHVMVRPEEAKAEVERALDLDPLNPGIQVWFALHLMFMRQYDDAIIQAREVLKIKPDSGMAHVVLQSAFRQKGLLTEQLAEERMSHLTDHEYVESLDRGYAQQGPLGAWKALAALTATRSNRTPGQAGCSPVLFIYEGEKDLAIDCLEKFYEIRSPDMVHLGVAPDWNPLRSDPRFQALIRKMNFPP
jgi:TolB-like protein/DNA-binding winged helix-turn-helix (wHTH) protein/tetratricopeptide (TPR) repeat protein